MAQYAKDTDNGYRPRKVSANVFVLSASALQAVARLGGGDFKNGRRTKSDLVGVVRLAVYSMCSTAVIESADCDAIAARRYVMFHVLCDRAIG